jgi:hypothetical protein
MRQQPHRQSRFVRMQVVLQLKTGAPLLLAIRVPAKKLLQAE